MFVTMAKEITRPLRNEADYEAAVDEIERYFDRPPKSGSPDADRFDLLSLVVEDYERERSPIDPPNPVDGIRYGMETRGLTQADLGRLLGSRQRASDILSRRRPLTMRMAWKLHRDWGISAEALIRPSRPPAKSAARGRA
jgi:HTH-type transcriptional regulator / antitoxin HigA